MHEGYVKDNYYAKFHTLDYHKMQRKPYFDVKLNKVKGLGNIGLTRAPGQGTCMKGMSRTITKQGFTLAAITDAERTKLQCKN